MAARHAPGSDHAGAAGTAARAGDARRLARPAGERPGTARVARAGSRTADGAAAHVGGAAIRPGAATASPGADVPALPRSLVYVSDESPGYRRQRRGKGFVYLQPDGHKLADPEQLDRIRRLAIPPAYREVWICPHPNGHLQATGRDARGRKQYRYHPDWRTARDTTKFERMEAFGSALPRIRARVKRDLDAPLGSHLSRAAVLAAVVRLLDTTLIRVGNDEYARSNGSYGLTTLRPRHVAVRGSALRLKFRGKSGVLHEAAVEDKRIARIVRKCQALPGQALFHHEDADGTVHSIDSGDVNDYLREASGGDFTAKDFRTWHGSVLALSLWHGRDEPAPLSRRDAKALLEIVADRLGNTAAVCRKAYVHPRVMEAWLAAPPDPLPEVPRKVGLSVAERHFLRFLRSGAEGLGSLPDCVRVESA